jgi:hypothetical protein
MMLAATKGKIARLNEREEKTIASEGQKKERLASSRGGSERKGKESKK